MAVRVKALSTRSTAYLIVGTFNLRGITQTSALQTSFQTRFASEQLSVLTRVPVVSVPVVPVYVYKQVHKHCTTSGLVYAKKKRAAEVDGLTPETSLVVLLKVMNPPAWATAFGLDLLTQTLLKCLFRVISVVTK